MEHQVNQYEKLSYKLKGNAACVGLANAEVEEDTATLGVWHFCNIGELVFVRMMFNLMQLIINSTVLTSLLFR